MNKQRINKKRSKLGRIIAGASALIIIGVLISLTIAFMGNPISASIANKDIKKYITQTYPKQEMEIARKAKYNFKDKTYTVLIKVKAKPEVSFYVAWKNGKIDYDEYDFVMEQLEGKKTK